MAGLTNAQREASKRPLCGAKLKGNRGECHAYPVKGSKRCKVHGGLSPRGTASPNYKTGKYSKHMQAMLRALPAQHSEIVQSFMDDVEPYNLKADIATLYAMEIDTLTKADGDISEETYNFILKLKEQRRKTQESELKRETIQKQMITKEQAISLFHHITVNIRECITFFVKDDKLARDMLTDINNRLQLFIEPSKEL